MSLVSGAQNIGSAMGPVLGGIFAQFVFGTVQPVSWINMMFNLIAMALAFSLLGIVGSGLSASDTDGKEVESSGHTISHE
ncbi:MAG: hypothetical protein ACXABY_27240 [Candidatus Thorarchaeota archaeon]